MTQVNLQLYSREIEAAGLGSNCASDGRVDFTDGTSWRPGDAPKNAQETTAAAVFAAHDKAAADAADALEAIRDRVEEFAVRRAALVALRVRAVALSKGTAWIDARIVAVDVQIAGALP